MQSIYYWKKYQPPTKLGRCFYGRDPDVRAQIRNEEFIPPPVVEDIDIQLPSFRQMYGKWLAASSFIGVASLAILIYYFIDFTYLGVGFVWYLTVLCLGIAAGIGLPVVWRRRYRRFVEALGGGESCLG